MAFGAAGAGGKRFGCGHGVPFVPVVFVWECLQGRGLSSGTQGAVRWIAGKTGDDALFGYRYGLVIKQPPVRVDCLTVEKPA